MAGGLDDVTCNFLGVKPGDIVIVEDTNRVNVLENVDWWMGHVLHCTGGSRDPGPTSICQVACLDTGIIKTINADLVKAILRPNLWADEDS